MRANTAAPAAAAQRSWRRFIMSALLGGIRKNMLVPRTRGIFSVARGRMNSAPPQTGLSTTARRLLRAFNTALPKRRSCDALVALDLRAMHHAARGGIELIAPVQHRKVVP